jgi:hypothetical protein
LRRTLEVEGYDMTRSIILRLFIASLIAGVVGTVLFVIAAVVGFSPEVLIMSGPDVVGIRPGARSTGMIVTAALASLLWVAATLAIVVAWVGAIVNTANLPSRTWLVIQLVVGLLGFAFVAVLAYLVGRPEETSSRGPVGPVQPGHPMAGTG